MRGLIFLFIIEMAFCYLWPKGVVHFDFNQKHFDPHTQDEIMKIFGKIENEVCVKFFLAQPNYEVGLNNKILFISNPNKRKGCLPDSYDFKQPVVNMTVGYNCINTKDLPRTVVDMLRASITESDKSQNEILNKENNYLGSNLLSIQDRNFINKHYYNECNKLNDPFGAKMLLEHLHRVNTPNKDGGLYDANIAFYSDKIWPLGVVNYAIEIQEGSLLEPTVKTLESAMNVIEASTCIQFHDIPEGQEGNYISFEEDKGEEFPRLGIQGGKQVLNIKNITNGTPGHKSHVLLSLLRILGLPLESNRADRNNYINIQWNNIEKGKEQHFELDSPNALLPLPYDFDSVTHAPANWWCNQKCNVGAQTIKPIGDHLWLRTMSMGRRLSLSDNDIKKIGLIYSHECKKRQIAEDMKTAKE